jgi:hypothetical protein
MGRGGPCVFGYDWYAKSYRMWEFGMYGGEWMTPFPDPSGWSGDFEGASLVLSNEHDATRPLGAAQYEALFAPRKRDLRRIVYEPVRDGGFVETCHRELGDPRGMEQSFPGFCKIAETTWARVDESKVHRPFRFHR